MGTETINRLCPRLTTEPARHDDARRPHSSRRTLRREPDAYRSGQYNETQVRREFIDPLFGLLGWDIDNRTGAPEAYKDVVHEDAIKVGGAHSAAD